MSLQVPNLILFYEKPEDDFDNNFSQVSSSKTDSKSNESFKHYDTTISIDSSEQDKDQKA